MFRNHQAVNGVNVEQVQAPSDDLSVTWLSLSRPHDPVRCSTVVQTRDCRETTSCELTDLYSTVELVLPISTVDYAAV